MTNDERDAARYRFLRQSEVTLSTEAEEILAVVWSKIVKKGCWLQEMDGVIDEAMRATAALDHPSCSICRRDHGPEIVHECE